MVRVRGRGRGRGRVIVMVRGEGEGDGDTDVLRVQMSCDAPKALIGRWIHEGRLPKSASLQGQYHSSLAEASPDVHQTPTGFEGLPATCAGCIATWVEGDQKYFAEANVSHP